jgi:hypothetical protein
MQFGSVPNRFLDGHVGRDPPPVVVQVTGAAEGMTYQIPSEGQTARSAFPSPSESRGTGTSFTPFRVVPHCRSVPTPCDYDRSFAGFQLAVGYALSAGRISGHLEV